MYIVLLIDIGTAQCNTIHVCMHISVSCICVSMYNAITTEIKVYHSTLLTVIPSTCHYYAILSYTITTVNVWTVKCVLPTFCNIILSLL